MTSVPQRTEPRPSFVRSLLRFVGRLPEAILLPFRGRSKIFVYLAGGNNTGKSALLSSWGQATGRSSDELALGAMHPSFKSYWAHLHKKRTLEGWVRTPIDDIRSLTLFEVDSRPLTTLELPGDHVSAAEDFGDPAKFLPGPRGLRRLKRDLRRATACILLADVADPHPIQALLLRNVLLSLPRRVPVVLLATKGDLLQPESAAPRFHELRHQALDGQAIGLDELARTRAERSEEACAAVDRWELASLGGAPVLARLTRERPCHAVLLVSAWGKAPDKFVLDENGEPLIVGGNKLPLIPKPHPVCTDEPLLFVAHAGLHHAKTLDRLRAAKRSAWTAAACAVLAFLAWILPCELTRQSLRSDSPRLVLDHFLLDTAAHLPGLRTYYEDTLCTLAAQSVHAGDTALGRATALRARRLFGDTHRVRRASLQVVLAVARAAPPGTGADQAVRAACAELLDPLDAWASLQTAEIRAAHLLQPATAADPVALASAAELLNDPWLQLRPCEPARELGAVLLTNAVGPAPAAIAALDATTVGPLVDAVDACLCALEIVSRDDAQRVDDAVEHCQRGLAALFARLPGPEVGQAFLEGLLRAGRAQRWDVVRTATLDLVAKAAEETLVPDYRDGRFPASVPALLPLLRVPEARRRLADSTLVEMFILARTAFARDRELALFPLVAEALVEPEADRDPQFLGHQVAPGGGNSSLLRADLDLLSQLVPDAGSAQRDTASCVESHYQVYEAHLRAGTDLNGIAREWKVYQSLIAALRPVVGASVAPRTAEVAHQINHVRLRIAKPLAGRERLSPSEFAELVAALDLRPCRTGPEEQVGYCQEALSDSKALWQAAATHLHAHFDRVDGTTIAELLRLATRVPAPLKAGVRGALLGIEVAGFLHGTPEPTAGWLTRAASFLTDSDLRPDWRSSLETRLRDFAERSLRTKDGAALVKLALDVAADARLTPAHLLGAANLSPAASVLLEAARNEADPNEAINQMGLAIALDAAMAERVLVAAVDAVSTSPADRWRDFARAVERKLPNPEIVRAVRDGADARIRAEIRDALLADDAMPARLVRARRLAQELRDPAQLKGHLDRLDDMTLVRPDAASGLAPFFIRVHPVSAAEFGDPAAAGADEPARKSPHQVREWLVQRGVDLPTLHQLECVQRQLGWTGLREWVAPIGTTVTGYFDDGAVREWSSRQPCRDVRFRYVLPLLPEDR